MPIIRDKLRQLGLELPPPRPSDSSKPYDLFVIHNRMLYVSGHIPDIPGERPMRGTLGADLDVAAGRAAARRVVRNLLATMEHAVGDLDRIERIIKVLGLVRATSEFTDHPLVINAASEIFVALWGEDAGRSSRSAVGVASLPLGVPVEIEIVAAMRP